MVWTFCSSKRFSRVTGSPQPLRRYLPGQGVRNKRVAGLSDRDPPHFVSFVILDDVLQRCQNLSNYEPVIPATLRRLCMNNGYRY